MTGAVTTQFSNSTARGDIPDLLVGRRSGTNRYIAWGKQPRRGQSRGLLHPVRFAVHEDPEPELEVDERPDHVGRQDTLAQPVGMKDSPVETPWGSEDVLHGAGQLTG